VLGTRQSGLPRLKFATLPEDEELLLLARAWAEWLLEGDPELEASEHALLREAVGARFELVEPPGD
jgi:ATP-dependent DNA helicase RecG